jgi:tetratricopeptide (TPR) repeat protein
MRILRHVVIGLALMIAGASQASAAWLRASSAHFVLYANMSEKDLREQAVQLERFDAMLRFFHSTRENPDAAFNRVTIYVVPDVDTIRRLTNSRNAAGFYVPRVEGSVAFTPRATGDGSALDLNPRIVLQHEYAHHFLLGSYATAYPAWFSEGYAEFASTARKRDGANWLGTAANHRAYSLMVGPGMSTAQLFAPPPRMNGTQMEAIYSRGWLLTHYLLLDPDRQRQLATYIDLFNRGVPSVEAGTRAFGDLRKLDRALDSYLNQRRLTAVRLTDEQLGTPAVEVTPLTSGQAAMIDLRIRSTAGVDRKSATALYARAAPVAARYPGEAVVQGWFAEIAIDAGQLDAAEHAADAALAVDPRSSQALLYKARVLIARAALAKSTDAAQWDAARRFILRANRVQNNDAAALALFYQSFIAQGIEPRTSAKQGLDRAVELVPQDPGTRYMAARQQILDDRVAEAKRTLRPLAANPHAGPDNPAARMLAALEAGKTRDAVLAVAEQGSPAIPAGGDGND